MNSLSPFQNIHKDETIIVCGCGESLNELQCPERFITIGVNDVGRQFDPTYLVVVNPRNQFKNDRFHYIETSQAQAIFTQLDLGIKHPQVVRFALGKRGGTDLSDPNVLHYTQNSPYVAVCLAAHMGAKNIGLIGVDFTDHHFFRKTGPHPLNLRLAKIKQEYACLAEALVHHGVKLVNLSGISKLDTIPKVSLKSFYDLATDIQNNPSRNFSIQSSDSYIDESEKIGDKEKAELKKLENIRVLHIAKTNCAGSLWNLHNILQKYTKIESRVVTESRVTNGIHYPKDVLLSNRASAAQLIEDADLIHFHNWIDKDSPEMIPFKSVLKKKLAVLQFHSEPALLRDHFPGRDPVARKDIYTLVVAQKHVRFFPNAIPVPNAIDIFDPDLHPQNVKQNGHIKVLFTPTDTENYRDYKSTCRGKGFEETQRILLELKRRRVIEAIIKTSVPRDELIKLRRMADIVIDECVTGGYHLTSLEGLAQGLVTIAFLDRETRRTICKITGSSVKELPWVIAPMDRLKDTLLFLADNPVALDTYRQVGRRWMEKYWHPDAIVRHYLKAYYRALNEGAKDSAQSGNNKHPINEGRNRMIVSSADHPEKNVAQNDEVQMFFVIPGKQNPRRSEEYPQTVRLNQALLSKKESLYDQFCHILGNGPSVKDFDMSLLSSRTVIGVNASPLLHEALGRPTDYYCISDRRFFERYNAKQIVDLTKESIRVFAGYCHGFIHDEDVNYIKIRGGDGVSSDLIQGFYHACSVVLFAAQLALWLGCRNIYLHGCEFDYRKGRFYREMKEMPHDLGTFARICYNINALSNWLNRNDGSITIVGPSRITGDFGSKPVPGVQRISINDLEKALVKKVCEKDHVSHGKRFNTNF